MTATPAVLGSQYDAPALLAASLHHYEAKRHLALAALRAAEATGQEDVVKLMHWELGLIDLIITPGKDVSPYGGASYEPYAAHFRLTSETPAYARERAAETQDIILKLHYLEFVLLQSEPRGRPWIQLQREILGAYRTYIDGCRAGVGNDPDGFAGLHIDTALRRVGQLVPRPGVLQPNEHAEWATWLLGLAEDSRSFPVRDPKHEAQQRHRWIAPYLVHLSSIPPEFVDEGLRSRAVRLLQDAAAYYQSTPLNDLFEHRVAEVEAALGRLWGETGTHERLIRRRFEATVRRAEFHQQTGNGLVTAHFFREARQLMEEQRQYFSAAEITRLELAEQAALTQAVEGGEFAEIQVPIEVPREIMDYTGATPEETVQALVEQAVGSIPDREELGRQAKEAAADSPLQSIINRTVIAVTGKVVGESETEEQNLALEVEQRATLLTRLLGAATAITISNAAEKVGLTAEHLVVPLAPLGLDKGTMAMIQQGCDRLIVGDFISATHILIPRLEDVMRQLLRSLGVDTTEFRRDVGDGTSRTDDATLGSLMRKSLPDGRSVKDYLGADLWNHLDSVLNSQTGLNLRNEFAHGLARPEHCSPANAGIVLSLLYQLAAVGQGFRPFDSTTCGIATPRS
jgi:hypothetical protein